MLIKSSFKDYWDYVVFETDNRKVFLRKPEIVDSDFIKLHPEFEKVKLTSATIKDRFDNNIVFLGEIAFCGTIYPYLFDFKTGNYYYNYDELDKKYVERLNKLRLRQAYDYKSEIYC